MKKEVKTTEELYKFITSKMSPEEALMKLLESASIQYEKLKFDKHPVHPVMIVTFAAYDMGWNLVIERGKKDVEGMMIRTSDFIERNLKIENNDTNT